VALESKNYTLKARSWYPRPGKTIARSWIPRPGKNDSQGKDPYVIETTNEWFLKKET